MREPPFLVVNPKGKVPTLVRDDGSVLTEFTAIATWLARRASASGLLPADPEVEARAAEVIAYVEGTIHGQGFTRMFEPQDAVQVMSASAARRSYGLRCQHGAQS